MASLKEVRIRIESINSTQQITSAMKLVAASKLRRTQTAVQALAPYAGKLREILENLTSGIENADEVVFTKVRPVQSVLLLVITSNRGLCGPFNSNVIKAARVYIDENYKEINHKGQLHLYTIGKKATDYFMKNKFNVVNANNDIFDSLTFAHTTTIAEELMAGFAAKKYDKIEIVYNHFKNAGQQVLTIDQYLPVIRLPNLQLQ